MSLMPYPMPFQTPLPSKYLIFKLNLPNTSDGLTKKHFGNIYLSTTLFLKISSHYWSSFFSASFSHLHFIYLFVFILHSQICVYSIPCVVQLKLGVSMSLFFKGAVYLKNT